MKRKPKAIAKQSGSGDYVQKLGGFKMSQITLHLYGKKAITLDAANVKIIDKISVRGENLTTIRYLVTAKDNREKFYFYNVSESPEDIERMIRMATR